MCFLYKKYWLVKHRSSSKLVLKISSRYLFPQVNWCFKLTAHSKQWKQFDYGKISFNVLVVPMPFSPLGGAYVPTQEKKNVLVFPMLTINAVLVFLLSSFIRYVSINSNISMINRDSPPEMRVSLHVQSESGKKRTRKLQIQTLFTQWLHKRFSVKIRHILKSFYW